MNAARGLPSSAGSGAAGVSERSMLVLFTATIFLSATLLFAVQPVFANMVLPVLGGSPSVWAVSMCFFQTVLLCGYCYAHALNRCFSQRTGLIVHAGVLATAMLALPVALPAFAHEAPSGSAYVWLISVLAAGVGLPFFAVSANAPLLQAWFARSGHKDAADPYFLYAASNIGSLLVLLAYPVFIQPALGVTAQGSVWSAGFMLLCAGIMACGASSISRAMGSLPPQHTAAIADGVVAAITWTERSAWIGLSFLPSALLVTFTTFLTTDIASAPFLWVLPLAFFLLTFVMVFRDTPVISHAALVDRQPLAAAIAIYGTASVSGSNWYIGLSGGVAAFIITSLVCHRELYLRRPAAAHLTEFYLWMSFGGVLGGIFSAIIAPQLFNSIFEFPLIVALGLLARPSVAAALRGVSADRYRALAMIGAGLAVLVAIDQAIAFGLMGGHFKLRIGFIAILIGATILFRKRPVLEMSAFALMLAVVAILPEGGGSSQAVRSFFGVHRVVTTPDGKFRLLMHGTTTHGARRMRSDDGAVLNDPVPATYYYAGAPMVQAGGIARATAKPGHGFRAGVVGLGAGAIACSAQPGDTWKFYEIDLAVAGIARDKTQFGFLSHCQPKADIIIGDARLTLAHEPPASFDYLLIDAFSSDAVPTHLMTAEAFGLYLNRLTPEGVLALHISNRHLDLAPVVAAGIASIPGYKTLLVVDRPKNPGNDTAPSRVVLVSKNEAAIAEALKLSGARELALTPGVAAWTDDYSDILSALVRGWTGKAENNLGSAAN